MSGHGLGVFFWGVTWTAESIESRGVDWTGVPGEVLVVRAGGWTLLSTVDVAGGP